MGKFRIDEWVLYCPFPDSKFESLYNERLKAVVLWEYDKGEPYDYEIFIDGQGKIKKVREHQLFPLSDSTY